MKIEFNPVVYKQLQRLPGPMFAPILRAVVALANEPHPPGALRLVGTADGWRVRIRDYRVLYTIDDTSSTLTIFRVGHRRDVYD